MPESAGKRHALMASVARRHDGRAVRRREHLLGHLEAAAGIAGFIKAVLALHHKILPPTINQTDPDPECDLDYIPNTARKAEINIAMSNAFGFGGHNSVLLFKRFSPS